jgi:hypothetical protein
MFYDPISMEKFFSQLRNNKLFILIKSFWVSFSYSNYMFEFLRWIVYIFLKNKMLDQGA